MFSDSQTEIENVSDNIDLLNSALDSIEERADRIRAQLLELLSSNREIRQSIREENEKLQPTNNDGNDDTSGSSSNVDEEQPENWLRIYSIPLLIEIVLCNFFQSSWNSNIYCYTNIYRIK